MNSKKIIDEKVRKPEELEPVGGFTAETEPILHVSDWNFQDKLYSVPMPILKEFKQKLLALDDADGISDVWEWFTNQVDYDFQPPKKRKKPVVMVGVDEDWDLEDIHNQSDYFLDYTNPIESAEEWDEV